MTRFESEMWRSLETFTEALRRLGLRWVTPTDVAMMVSVGWLTMLAALVVKA